MISTQKLVTTDGLDRIAVNMHAYQALEVGDIVKMDFGRKSYCALCSEQINLRPVIVLRAMKANEKTQMLPVVKVTSSVAKRCKWHVPLTEIEGLTESAALIEHLGSYSKLRIKSGIIGHVDEDTLELIQQQLRAYLGL